MLASRTEEPQEMTMEYLNVINDLFTFYHQSVSRILKVCPQNVELLALVIKIFFLVS